MSQERHPNSQMPMKLHARILERPLWSRRQAGPPTAWVCSTSKRWGGVLQGGGGMLLGKGDQKFSWLLRPSGSLGTRVLTC